MLKLKSDAEGFLVGELIKDFDKMERDIHAMSMDIAAIRSFLAGGGLPDAGNAATNAAGKTGTTQPITATVIPLRRSVGDAAMPLSEKKTVIATKGGGVNGKADKPTKNKQVRDEKGRFSSRTNANAAETGSKPLVSGDSVLSGITGRLKDAVVEGFSDSERVDPAIQAFQEVVTPLHRGFGIIFGDGRERKKERWYKRIWTTLKRKEIVDSKANTITHKRLRAIEEKPISDGGIGWLAMLLPVLFGIAKAIFGLPLSLAGKIAAAIAGALAKLLPGFLARRLPGMGLPGRNGRGGGAGVPLPDRDRGRNAPDTPRRRGRLGRIFDWGKDKLGRGVEIGAEAAKKGGGVVAGIGKRIGAVRGLGAIGGLLALAGVASTEMDDTLTREEKNREHGANAGRAATGLAGAAAGAAIGTAIFPVVGTVIGGIVGGIAADYFAGDAAAELGSKIADWVGAAPLSELPSRMVGKVGQWVDGLKQTEVGQAVIAKVNEWTQTLKDSEIGKYITERWNTLTADMKATWDVFSTTLTDTWNKLKEGTTKTLEGVNSWIKDKTGVDVGATIGVAYDGAKAMASEAYTATKDAASEAYEYTKDAASEVITGRKSSTNERWEGGARDDIVAAAKATGMDAGVLANIAHYESMGFDHEARPVSKSKPHLNDKRQFDGTMAMSTAYGYGQFTDATWMDMLNKHGAKHGVKGAGSLTKDEANAFRKDRKLQAIMLAEFSKDNIATAKKYGGTDDLANAYALHNLGGGDGGGGAKFLQAMTANPNAKVSSVLSDDIIKRNTGLYGKSGEKTLEEAYNGMSAYMHQGDSYAREAHNLQNGIVAPTAGGVVASAVNMASAASNLGKTVYDKGKAWADGAIPESVKRLRVKSSDGSTKTLDGLGIESHADLQGKGGQAFSGGYNDPATLYATSLIQHGMGDNFDRITAQNDKYHNAKSPSSEHTKGNKTDFTVKNMSGAEADQKTAEIMAKFGLEKGVDFETINEYDNPSAKATGGHIDFKLSPSGQSKIRQVMALDALSKPAVQAASAVQDKVSVAGYYDYGQPSPSAPVVSKSATIPAAPAIASVPRVPDAPAEFSPISSGRPANQSPVNITLPEFLVGQDVRDRRIAHIATGGISG